MFKFKNTFVVLLAVTALAGCSSMGKKEVQAQEDKIKEQPLADTPEEIAMRAATIFSNAPDLTDEQKQQLHTIYTNVYDEAMVIRREIGQSKSLMYETLVKSDYKSAEIDRLKKKIVDLDKKRLDIMFKALKDVQKIVGMGQGKEKVYKHLGDYDKYK